MLLLKGCDYAHYFYIDPISFDVLISKLAQQKNSCFVLKMKWLLLLYNDVTHVKNRLARAFYYSYRPMKFAFIRVRKNILT